MGFVTENVETMMATIFSEKVTKNWEVHYQSVLLMIMYNISSRDSSYQWKTNFIISPSI